MLVQQIYPTNFQLRSEIPLWLKFRAFEYQGFLGRAGNGFQGVQPSPPNQLGLLYVPAPKLVSSGVTNQFNENPADKIFQGAVSFLTGLGKLTSFKSPGGTINPIGTIGTGLSVAGTLIKGIYDIASYFSGVIAPDFNDNIYAGTNKRTYQFDIVLPCLTDEDSFASFAIARSFEALSVASTTGSILAFNHPPMWLFGIGPGTGPQIDFTWLTDTQLCTLQSVAINRSAPDSGTYTVLTDYGLKPSVTTISLKFVEIEPVYRQSGTLSLITRSQAFNQNNFSI
jgi:hypothetical protein